MTDQKLIVVDTVPAATEDVTATQIEIDNALTLKEVRERTGLSMVYIRRRISTGKWHAFKDDKGRNRILVREVVEWEEWRKIASEKQVARKAAAVVTAKAKAEKKAEKAAAKAAAEAAKAEKAARAATEEGASTDLEIEL